MRKSECGKQKNQLIPIISSANKNWRNVSLYNTVACCLIAFFVSMYDCNFIRVCRWSRKYIFGDNRWLIMIILRVLVANFSKDQLARYECFRRSCFPKNAVKKVLFEKTFCSERFGNWSFFLCDRLQKNRSWNFSADQLVLISID